MKKIDAKKKSKKNFKKFATKAKSKLQADKPLGKRVFKVAPRIISRVGGGSGKVFIMDLNVPDRCYSLDSWAAESWLLIDGKTSASSIITAIKKKSRFDHDFVEEQVSSLIESLLRAALITD